MSLPTVTERVRRATSAIGKGSEFAGMCEKFTRGHFGFPARYGSAKLAYQASKRDGKVHVDYNAPAGVPVFWDILSGKNAPYDHVAISVGGGYCISTSAGPGGTVAKVSIRDLTQRWGMRYLGWAEFYHGQRVYTPPKKATPFPASRLSANPTWDQLFAALDLVVRGAKEDGGYKTRAKRIQHWLLRAGFLKTPSGRPGIVDGNWGPESWKALQRRLSDKRLRKPYTGPIDGIAPRSSKEGTTWHSAAAFCNDKRATAKKA